METLKNKYKIEFDKPAGEWNEALPIGNGKLGGMVYGYPFTERIQLNEDSVWFGGPQDRNNPSAKEKLPEIRRLIFEGKYLKHRSCVHLHCPVFRKSRDIMSRSVICI